MRVLVTGGAGFIGSHLVDGLLRDPDLKASVRVVDNVSNGNAANLRHVLDKIEYREGDLLDPSVRAWALDGVDAVLHHAALGSVTRSIERPVDTHIHGAHLTLLLLESARAQKVRRFVYASSSSVYGGEGPFPQREDTPPRPLSPYAATKLAGEHYVAACARAFGMEAAAFRYFNVFGPRQRADSPYSAVVAKFCAAFRDGRPIAIHGDGEQARDFTYVENVVHANLLALKAAKLGGETINIACGEAHSLNEMVRVLGELSGRTIAPSYGPPRLGDVRRSLAELTRAATLLAYRPVVDFRTGLARTLAWYQTEKAAGALPS
ncbi:MAG: NAD-dependent epimerase/dehydratase family protein [Planctomycetes bacterium]|nr:NAD-dependent epimerase/dehydratase family protein [Planctomycetota bacterium]